MCMEFPAVTSVPDLRQSVRKLWREDACHGHNSRSDYLYIFAFNYMVPSLGRNQGRGVDKIVNQFKYLYNENIFLKSGGRHYDAYFGRR